MTSDRTLLITEIFPPKVGGSSRWFWEIYRRLPREEFVIAAGEDSRQHEFDRGHHLRMKRMPLTFSDWGILNIGAVRNYWRALNNIERIVKSEGIGRIHCGRLLPEGWLARIVKRRHRIPYVCYVHGEEANTTYRGQSGGVLSSRQLRWMTRKVTRDADFVIANSENTKNILMQQWDLPSGRIRLMYPGVDTRQFVPAPRDEDVRAALGWKERQVVLVVGRLEARKGHDRMLLALREIRKAIPNVLYAIVGDGERREFLRELVVRENLSEHVQFIRHLSDDQLVQCYQQCELFVLSNRQVGTDIEGFGMVLLEAQACGKPVVAGASGGTAEAMRVPETGRVILCDDPYELQSVVTELLNDSELRTRMGESARKWVVERFDWLALSQQAMSLFNTIPPTMAYPRQRLISGESALNRTL